MNRVKEASRLTAYFLFISMAVFFTLPAYNASAIELCTADGGYDADVMGGEYHVMNNVWGSCPGVGDQCIEVNLLSTYFKVTESNHTGGCVAAYPAVYKGCNWGVCTGESNMPARVRTLVTAPFTWDVNPGGAAGTWNVAMDVWFSSAGQTSPYGGAELMIWLRANGGAAPGGTRVARNVSIGGTTWDVYFADWSGSTGFDYVAYKKVSAVNTVNLDLKPFIDDAVSRGYISPMWYLIGIEGGFEIWSNGVGLTTNSFSASVTATVDNNAPQISIVSPHNGDSFVTGSDIVIDVNAVDTDGYVTKVEFFNGANKLGESTTAPFSYTWQSVPAGFYLISAKATDDYGDSNTSSSVSFGVVGGGAGSVLREWWTGIAGSDVCDLTGNINYPKNYTGRGLITSLEGPTNWADNYGTRIRGYLKPAANGDYTLWIASDAASELWLSADDNPANAALIAYVPGSTDPHQWDKYPQQQSSPVTLAANGKYYIEVLHKAADANDNVSVAWQGPGITQQVISGLYLSPCCFNFTDFSRFGINWRSVGCNSSNSWCAGCDFNRNGTVLIDDLKLFADAWLSGLD